LVDQLRVMGTHIPFGNKGHQPFCQMIDINEIADTQPEALAQC